MTVRHALLWVLSVALLSLLALIVFAPVSERELRPVPPRVTTPSTTTPIPYVGEH